VADRLKDFFDEALVRSIGRDLGRAWPGFAERSFVAACLAGLDRLELTARGRQVAGAMHRHLPADFPAAAEILIDSLGPELDGTGSFGMAPFRYMPHVFFVGEHGLDHFEESMRAQHELTRRFSAEWSIRGFLERHPAATLGRLEEWTRDPSPHVRRLVSEGTRPRLPWAPRLRRFQDDPTPVLRLLELLKDDPERYVQRSVANNLNDIGKDHPAIAVEVCRRWSLGAPPARRWIVQHALRSLIKRGDRGALATLGFAAAAKVKVEAVRFQPRRVKIGGTLRFSFDLVSTAARAQELLVDYAIHFVKANGSRAPKVFKLRQLVLAARQRVELAGRVSFAPMTTRRPRAGRHEAFAIINGVAVPLGQFLVVA
jgi:3-methyladenine DNA glycosylase AlkC